MSLRRSPLRLLPPAVARELAHWETGVRTGAKTDRHSLLFTGPVGTMKTRAAAWCAEQAGAAGWTVAFTTQKRLLRAMQESLSGAGPQVIHRAASTVDLLVIDELGSEVVQPWAREQLYLVVVERMYQERPVVVTCDLDHPRLLGELVGPEVTGKLQDMCRGISTAR